MCVYYVMKNLIEIFVLRNVVDIFITQIAWKNIINIAILKIKKFYALLVEFL